MKSTFSRRVVGRFWAAGLAALMISVEATACLWDRDTVVMESRVFPGTLEVMTGQFPRHSAEFYAWREAEVKQALARDMKNPVLLDDLAVALHKQGRHRQAIELMTAALQVHPNRYETLSNLGTFAIYDGDLAASRAWLMKALEVNPDAHFGREQYQLWLVEQLMLKKDPSALPELTAGFSEATIKTLQTDYAKFVQLRVNLAEGWSRQGLLRELSVDEQAKAVQGVLGMMRFADFDNPLLQAALGDLLAPQVTSKKASQLAALAYEQALMRTSDVADREALIAKKLKALPSLRDKNRHIELVKKLDENLAGGRKLNASVRKDEIAWIRARKDVEKEFEAKYLSAPPLLSK